MGTKFCDLRDLDIPHKVYVSLPSGYTNFIDDLICSDLGWDGIECVAYKFGHHEYINFTGAIRCSS